MSLKKYQQKRKFTKTPEPKGAPRLAPLARGLRRFVIQEHHATNLHYDFRLESEGVLKSWAVPKNLPKIKGPKRLAIQTEDHPVDYINFEGEIPEGNYGAGKVKVWDSGNYEIRNQKSELRNVKSMKILLKGKKIKGEYAMVKLQGKNWLIFKT